MPRQTKSRARASAGKRHPLNMRTTKETRDRLEKAAATVGRSLAQEVEFRLERSFEREAMLPEVMELAFGPKLAGLLWAMGLAMRGAGQAVELRSTDVPALRDWFDNPWAYDQMVRAANSILEWRRPSGDIVALDKVQWGEGMAGGIIDQIMNDKSGPQAKEAPRVCELLFGASAAAIRRGAKK